MKLDEIFPGRNEARINDIANRIFARIAEVLMTELTELEEAHSRGEVSYNDCLVVGGLLSAFLVGNAKEFIDIAQTKHPKFAGMVYKELFNILVGDEKNRVVN